MADDGWNSEEDQYFSSISKAKSQFVNENKQGNMKRNYCKSNEYQNNVPGDAVQISTSLVGKVIGRGGSKIRELQDESRARLQIIKSEDGSDITTIKLTGTEDAKAKARKLIEELVAPQHNRRNGRYKKESSYNNAYVEDSNKSYDTDNQNINNSSTQEDASVQEDVVYDWQAILAKQMKLQEAHWATLPPIYKNFYVEDPEIAGMSDKDVEEWRLMNNNIMVERVQHDMSTDLPKIPNPVHSFEQAFSAYPEILSEIYKQNFSKPSPIQSQAWPILLQGEDLIGIAQTGTGKTLAFLLPALIHIDRQPVPLEERAGPNVLVLAPTRELAIQIDKEVKKYQYKDYKSVCIYGGASRSEQIDAVSRGVQIVIATPGRLNDLVKSKKINIEAVTYLVLDEADRMLDMGFGPQIRVSLLEIRPNRQTVMTSATWPSGVQRLAELYMKNPIRAIVGSLDLAAVHSVEQELLFVNDDIEEKFQILMDFFDNYLKKDDKVIVFCSKKTTTITIATDLALKGIHFQSIYGGLDQADREQALEDMRNGSTNILVATDIASRGIDIDNITHIINFDFPTNLEEFVHRVGRTGRAGRSGKAITYMTRRDWDKAEGLIKILEEAGQYVPEELVLMAERFSKKKESNPGHRGGRRRGGGGGYNRYDY